MDVFAHLFGLTGLLAPELSILKPLFELRIVIRDPQFVYMIILSTHPSKRMDIQESPSTWKTIIFLKMVRITLAHYDNFPSPGASRIFCQVTCKIPSNLPPPTCHLSAAVLAPFNTCHCNCRLPISTPDPDYFLVMENCPRRLAVVSIPFNSGLPPLHQPCNEDVFLAPPNTGR